MIKTLLVENYALIDKLEIEFSNGLSTITGETGAGKSILLGALSLILGQRADVALLKNKAKKCIIEGHFDIKNYELKTFFGNQIPNADYEPVTIIRRIISPNGKSRAFVNDSPVNLNVLKELGLRLVDIHSQHQNQLLTDVNFQLRVIDAFAHQNDLVLKYKTALSSYKREVLELKKISEAAATAKADYDYFSHRHDELSDAQLVVDEQIKLEKEQETLSHAEEIISNLSQASHLISEDEFAAVNQLKDATDRLFQIAPFFGQAEKLHKRLESTLIEVTDIASEVEVLVGDVEFDPNRAQELEDRLNLIYSLLQKHRVSSVNQLIEIKENLLAQIVETDNFDVRIEELKQKVAREKTKVEKIANQISRNRTKVFPAFEAQISASLAEVGMPNALFKIQNLASAEFLPTGIDKISFMFASGRKMTPQDITKVASGGEMSRVMLAIKSLISNSIALPSIIFDEIDTGVSGDIADKIGVIMQKMSQNMQVLTITHLPQVASKGDFHYLVYKEDNDGVPVSNIKQLSKPERITVIAKMLSGENLTEAAIQNARELLN